MTELKTDYKEPREALLNVLYKGPACLHQVEAQRLSNALVDKSARIEAELEELEKQKYYNPLKKVSLLSDKNNIDYLDGLLNRIIKVKGNIV